MTPAKPLAAFVALCCWFACEERPANLGPRSDPPPILVEDTAPPIVPPDVAPPRGAVLTVVTSVGTGAAAATLDQVGLNRIRLADDEGHQAALDLPPGGAGFLGLAEVRGPSAIEVELTTPAGASVGANAIAVDDLAGTVGVLGLELGVAATARRACLRCSEPEELTPIRGLFDTMLLWSAASTPVTGADGERLHVATRQRLSGEVRRDLVAAAGGRIDGPETVDPDTRLVWSVVVPDRAADALELALRLARHPEVKALELYQEGASGRLYEPARPQPLGTGLGTGG